MEQPYNVLFLCTHNSARSILCESILNHLGRGRFRGFSAGSSPAGKVNPLAIETLKKAGHDITGLHSKSWEEFAESGAPKMDLVITVCDHAAGEVCPIWPGHPVKVHWGLTDPSLAPGGEPARRSAFENTYKEISRRINVLISLPIKALDRAILEQKLNEIGTRQ